MAGIRLAQGDVGMCDTASEPGAVGGKALRLALAEASRR
jgi:hypothetical protein